MLPSENLHYIFHNILTKFLRLFCINYINPAYSRKSIGTIIVAFLMVVGLGFIAYTLIVADSEIKLQCMTLIPVACQGIIKYYVFTKQAGILRVHVDILYGIYKQCDVHEVEAVCLNIWARIFKRVINIFIITVSLCVAGFCFLPPYIYLITGEWTAMVPIQLPYIDVGTFSGYLVLLFYHISLIIITTVGGLAFDLSLCMQILHVCPLSNVIILKLRKLKNELIDFPDYARRRETTVFLNNIICMHKEYFLYMKSLSDVYYVVILLEVLLNGICMCLVIFVLLQISWFPLYMFFNVFMLKTLITCALGTICDHYVSVDNV